MLERSDETGEAPVRASARFLLAHPAHAIALGFGAGLSPRAPGTVGTLWAWLSFALLHPLLSWAQLALVIALAALGGWWACAVAARNLRTSDPGCIVWDEVVAFWLVLLFVMPAPWWEQLLVFALFRFFDAAKPGPVGWADRLLHRIDPQRIRFGWPGVSLGILFDDLVAAFCCLFVFALWRTW
jgi:phosphatidylglycerophosphatase A